MILAGIKWSSTFFVCRLNSLMISDSNGNIIMAYFVIFYRQLTSTLLHFSTPVESQAAIEGGAC